MIFNGTLTVYIMSYFLIRKSIFLLIQKLSGNLLRFIFRVVPTLLNFKDGIQIIK